MCLRINTPCWKTFILALTACLFVKSALGTRPTPCPRQCRSCNDAGQVDCSSRSLTTPPRDYPNGTQVLNLENNNIRTLGSRSFTIQPTVQELKVAKNKISILTNHAFGRLFPNLMTLDLTENRINRISRRALRGMANLRTLTLSKNRIRSLSNIFHGTPNLYQLNLARNRIRRLGKDDLSPLTTVHYVDLRGNKISNIHPKAFKELDRLRYLFLNGNPIVQMPAMEWGTEVLQMIDMSRCQLISVPQPLPASVTDLRLGRNNIRQVNHTDFSSVTDLQLLALHRNQLNFFADGALQHLSRLTELWLRNNELIYVPRDLPTNVKRVHMDSNRIQQIENRIFSNMSQIHYLNLQNNQINRIHPNTLSELRFLQTLNLQGNQLTTLEPSSFAELGSLSTLIINNNPLSRIEAGAFHNLGNLTMLQLSYITSENFELDSDFLPEMLRLESLGLMNSPGLAQALMEKVEMSGHRTPLSRLQSLDLSYNTLEYIPSRVKEIFPSLTSMPLDGNPLHCSRRLQWLQQWMAESASAVSFSHYEEPTCTTPNSLNSRPITTISGSEWTESDTPEVHQTWDRSGYAGGIARDQPAPESSGLYGTLVKVLVPNQDEEEAEKRDKARKAKLKKALEEGKKDNEIQADITTGSKSILSTMTDSDPLDISRGKTTSDREENRKRRREERRKNKKRRGRKGKGKRNKKQKNDRKIKKGKKRDRTGGRKITRDDRRRQRRMMHTATKPRTR